MFEEREGMQMVGEGEPADGITLGPLEPGEAGEARALILAGLAEHWGRLDLTLNPDLDDIRASYAHGVFLVARLDGRIVGTGALVAVGAGDVPVGQIVRMSVAAPLRRRGLGRRILDRLMVQAASQGYRRIVLETTASWLEVVAFYERCGFRITHYQAGDVYLSRDLR